MSRSTVPLLMLTAALASSCGLPEEETSPALSTTAQAATPTQLSYVLFPHPDDEYEGWALIDNSTSNYKVFIMMTRGEETSGCLPASAGIGGPHWYEGPNSPVGRPDYTGHHQHRRTHQLRLGRHARAHLPDERQHPHRSQPAHLRLAQRAQCHTDHRGLPLRAAAGLLEALARQAFV